MKGHKLKWIIRSFHDPDLSKKSITIREQESKAALEEGIRTLMEFGENLDKTKREFYKNELEGIISRNAIHY